MLVVVLETLVTEIVVGMVVLTVGTVVELIYRLSLIIVMVVVTTAGSITVGEYSVNVLIVLVTVLLAVVTVKVLLTVEFPGTFTVVVADVTLTLVIVVGTNDSVVRVLSTERVEVKVGTVIVVENVVVVVVVVVGANKVVLVVEENGKKGMPEVSVFTTVLVTTSACSATTIDTDVVAHKNVSSWVKKSLVVVVTIKLE